MVEFNLGPDSMTWLGLSGCLASVAALAFNLGPDCMMWLGLADCVMSVTGVVTCATVVSGTCCWA